MNKLINTSKIILTTILLISAGILSTSLSASEEAHALGQSMFQESVTAVACGDRALLDLAGLDYDACLSKSEEVVPDCWAGMQPLLPDLRFGQADFESEENQERLLSAIFILEKCLQASVLLRSDENAGVRRNGTNIAQEYDENRRLINRNWAAVIEKEQSKFVVNADSADRISKGMVEDGLASIVVDSQGEVTAFSDDDEMNLERVIEHNRPWNEIFDESGVQYAYLTDDGVTLGIGREVVTDLHSLNITYVLAHRSKLPQCESDLQRLKCGSCELDQSEDAQAILTWHSRDLARSVEEKDLTEQMSMFEQCWEDEMSSIGFNLEQF